MLDGAGNEFLMWSGPSLQDQKHTVVGTVADIQGAVYPAASGSESERQNVTVPEGRAE